MPKKLSALYRTAFVTGASTGLGRAFAEMLLAEGVHVWGTSRDLSRLGYLSRPSPAPLFTPVALDLRDGDAAEAVFRDADRKAGGFDLLINNAGFGVFAEFTPIDFSLWQEQLDVMLISPTRLAHAALRSMLARPAAEQRSSAIINISSLAMEFPLPFQAVYNVAKAGLTALSESLMIETVGTHVAVIDFRPGDYRTDLDASMRHPQSSLTPRMKRAWTAFEAMMRCGPPPAHAADTLRRALLRRRSGTVRTGRFFQSAIAPFLARFGSLELKRRIQARYFNV